MKLGWEPDAKEVEGFFYELGESRGLNGDELKEYIQKMLKGEGAIVNITNGKGHIVRESET